MTVASHLACALAFLFACPFYDSRAAADDVRLSLRYQEPNPSVVLMMRHFEARLQNAPSLHTVHTSIVPDEGEVSDLVVSPDHHHCVFDLIAPNIPKRPSGNVTLTFLGGNGTLRQMSFVAPLHFYKGGGFTVGPTPLSNPQFILTGGLYYDWAPSKRPEVIGSTGSVRIFSEAGNTSTGQPLGRTMKLWAYPARHRRDIRFIKALCSAGTISVTRDYLREADFVQFRYTPWERSGEMKQGMQTVKLCFAAGRASRSIFTRYVKIEISPDGVCRLVAPPGTLLRPKAPHDESGTFTWKDAVVTRVAEQA